jgi:hypothetical protein
MNLPPTEANSSIFDSLLLATSVTIAVADICPTSESDRSDPLSVNNTSWPRTNPVSTLGLRNDV